MAIQKTPNGTYVMSARGVWRPGSYDSERTARLASRLTDTELRNLQNEANEGVGVLTHDVIKSYMMSRRETQD